MAELLFLEFMLPPEKIKIEDFENNEE